MHEQISPLVLQQLKQDYQYDPHSGKLTKRNKKIGYFRASKKDNGYIRITLRGYRRKYPQEKMPQHIYAHRLAWILYYGTIPDCDIDHIDRDGSNNRIDNLRLATASQNMWNRTKNRTYLGRKTSSIYKGVCWHKTSRKFAAKISFMSKRKHLGYFTDEVAAAQAYDEAASRLFGTFARLNFPSE